MRSVRAFTLIELLVVVTIIALLVAMLSPALEDAVSRAQVARCAANMKQVGTGWFMYVQDHHGQLPGVRYRGSGIARVKDFADPRFFRTVPNPLGSLVPYFGGGRPAFVCPVATVIPDSLNPTGEYTPTEQSNSNYFPNGVVFIRKLPQVYRPSDTVFMQENLFRSNSIWYRPGDGNVEDANELYRWWHFTRGGAGQEFSSIHQAGGNLTFGDGRVEYRRGAQLRARDFGLTGNTLSSADDTQQAPDDWTYRAAE